MKGNKIFLNEHRVCERENNLQYGSPVTEDGAWWSKHIGHRASFLGRHPLGPCTPAAWLPLSALYASQLTVPCFHLTSLARWQTRPEGKRSHTLQGHVCPAHGLPRCSFTRADEWILTGSSGPRTELAWPLSGKAERVCELQGLEAINRDTGGQSPSRIKP